MRFNEYLKELCEIAEIEQSINGRLYDKKKKRKIAKLYPKYIIMNLISSLFRRYCIKYLIIKEYRILTAKPERNMRKYIACPATRTHACGQKRVQANCWPKKSSNLL